jgi:hypothetical protein
VAIHAGEDDCMFRDMSGPSVIDVSGFFSLARAETSLANGWNRVLARSALEILFQHLLSAPTILFCFSHASL